MKTGDKAVVIPEFTKTEQAGGKRGGVRTEGVCVYCDPKERYATLEFSYGTEKIRECFWLDEINRRMPI